MTRASILAEALRLPVEERAKLISELIKTVEDQPYEEPELVEEAWTAELQARLDRADAHPEQSIDWATLRGKLTAK